MRIVNVPTTHAVGDARNEGLLALYGILFDATKNTAAAAMTLHESSEAKVWWTVGERPVLASPRQVFAVVRRHVRQQSIA